MIAWFKRMIDGFINPQVPQPEPEPVKSLTIKATALEKSLRKASVVQAIEPYEPPTGVIPAGERAAALAMDATPYDYVNQAYVNNYFPGYQYLAMLAQLPEYRKFGEVPAKDMMRKWIKLRAKDKQDKTDRISKILDAMTRYDVRGAFQKAVELDALFGRAQIFIDVDKPGGSRAADDPNELKLPLIVDPAKIRKGALKAFRVIEPVWTYPSAYNATDPLAPNYYRPMAWYVMGKTVHTSRLLSIVSRPVPDLLKAAYNFGGLSMSQMAQPYVQNWIRTRDSVSDLVHSFSVSGVKTNMEGVLSGADDAQFFNRAQLFNNLRDNRGLMLLDKDSEEFFQFNTPLSGLGELQEQAQEQLATISSIPLVKLLGSSPQGLNASSEGEIKVYYDSLHAYQEAVIRPPLQIALDVIQLSEFGDIDRDIVFEFESLDELSDSEQATVRKSDADTAAVYVGAGVVSPDEVRAKLAADPASGYDSLEEDSEDDDDELELRQNSMVETAKVREE